MESNYWLIPNEDLPSLCKLYNENTKIYCKMLSVMDLKYLSTINEENAEHITNGILEHCLKLEGITYEDLLLADREYLLFWLRINSFSKNNTFENEIFCQKCQTTFKYNINFSQFEIYHLTIMPHTLDLPDCGVKLYLSYPTVRELKRKNDDAEIQTFLRHLRFTEYDDDLIVNFLKGLSAFDYTVLKNAIDEMAIGFDKELKIYCPRCNAEHIYKVEIDENGVLGKINVMEIMEAILKICKYTNFQIPDNMPWWEVEVAQEVTNKIALEEQQELDRQHGKMTLNR